MELIRQIRAGHAGLLSMIPGDLQNCIELQSIFRAVDAELDRLYDALQQVLDEQFIETATGDGLRRLERENGIVPGDGATDEARRMALLLHTIERRPFTEASLYEMISSTIHGYNFHYEIDYEEGTLALTLYGNAKAYKADVEALLRRILPLNLVWQVKTEEATTYNNMTQYTYDELAQFTHDEI